MENNKLEIRSIGNIRSVGEGRTVEGYAAVFDAHSVDIGWVETIERGAITDEVIKNSDVFARLDHRDDVVLARCKFGSGSLFLEVRDEGLYFRFDAPETAHGEEVLSHIRRGEITECSFAFTIADDPDAEEWYTEGGVTYRVIHKIDRLYDVSTVYTPAYPQTSVIARDKAAAMKEQIAKELRQKYDAMLADVDAISDIK